MATNLTDAELQQLLSEGLSQADISRRTGMARSTLRRRIAKFGAPHVDTSASDDDTSASDEDTPNVYDSTQISKHAIETGDTELQELLAWWRERKRSLQTEADTEQETERKTYHVQKRYIEAIQRAADLEHISIMEIVNRAFGYYFNRAST
jgi:transcriptional regulator with XRE-family HTH domain